MDPFPAVPRQGEEAELRVFLDGLPVRAAGPAGALSQSIVVLLGLPRLETSGWRVRLPGVAADAPAVPFLPELARRLLAIGHVLKPGSPCEDPLLSPLLKDAIDAHCEQEALATARTVAALELESVAVLACVIGRRLAFLATSVPGAWPASGWNWLAPLLHDGRLQCLLCAALVEGSSPTQAHGRRLWPHLISLYHASARTQQPWPGGPLAACCALGLALSRPHEIEWLRDLAGRVADWNGWQQEDAWPVWWPGADLTDLKRRLTEGALVALDLAGGKRWRLDHLKRQGLDPQVIWPPLGRFCTTVASP